MNHLRIQGNSVNDYFSYIQIKFLLCIDNERNCIDKDKIESVFQSLKPMAYIYFMDTIFQTNNSRKRIKHFINYVDVNVTFHNAKVNNIYFSKNEMNVDDSYFFASTPKVYQYYMIDSFRDLVSVRTDHQKEALLVNLLSSKNKQVINITYMQLSELLANVGAVINIIIFFITLFGDYVNHYIFQNELMMELYFFETNENNSISIKTDKLIPFNITTKPKESKKSCINFSVNPQRKDVSSSKINIIDDINFKQLSHKNVLQNNNIEIQKTDLIVDTSLHVKKKKMKYPLKEQKIFSYTTCSFNIFNAGNA